MEESDKKEKSNYDIAWNLLTEKGLTFGERMMVRRAFAEWAHEFNLDVENDRKHNVFRNKKVTGYCFSTEAEAEFAGAITKLVPDCDKEKAITVMTIVLKLLNIESEWAFNYKTKKS